MKLIFNFSCPLTYKGHLVLNIRDREKKKRTTKKKMEGLFSPKTSNVVYERM